MSPVSRSAIVKTFAVLFLCLCLGVAVVHADNDWLPANAGNQQFIYHDGKVTIGKDDSGTKLFRLHIEDGTNDGLWLVRDSVSGDFGLGLLGNVGAGYYGQITQAGDFMLMARGPNKNLAGITINTWHDGGGGGIRINPWGKVGIGTGSPAHVLSVNGMVESMSNGFKFPDGTIQTTAGGDNHSLDAPDGNPVDALIVTNDGNVAIGATGTNGNMLYVNGVASVESIEIRGADLAERFDVNGPLEIVPGVVASIDPDNPGSLRVSNAEYDRTVVGVVSGANGVRTGITMGQPGTEADGEHAIAMTGRVYVNADAGNGSIAPGDLLTTSPILGHVMKVTDHQRAVGAILGKAMTALDKGTGQVLMVVALQ